ncbi:MAG: thioredoxin [Oscillospiraceae bacterium]|nr:thioredoxin [Oscillospiraceae bacterium]
METVLTLSNFDSTVSSPELTVVDFWATWCGPCKMIAPVLEEIVNETGLSLGKVNVDEERELAVKYNIQFIPTLLFFKDGKEINRLTGYMDKNSLMSAISQYR